MDREHRQRLKGILDEVRERHGAERETLVDRFCDQNPELAGELRSLLGAADETVSLDNPTVLQAAAALPDRIGPYRIVSKLGEGGMGVVYEAEQANPRRKVAVKIVRGGQFVDEHRARLFQREADTLARLKHPGIGAIFESGRTEHGQHFFAMELVQGRPLDAYIKNRSGALDHTELRFRLSLFRKISDAVHYAHQRGVIHRDLKPSNIFVTEESAREEETVSGTTRSGMRLPEVKILDFGLARITDGDVAAATMTTEIGVIKGTLPYMSPEQARGDPKEIDLRSDVYALGVILYEMLCGKRPYEVTKKSLAEAVRVICEEPPTSLGQSWSGVRRLDPDVETIVGRALEKDAGRRYSSAAALAEDVARYLTSQPILARPPSTTYQLRKFAARNRALVGGVLATILVLIAGVMVSTTLSFKEARQRRAADFARDEARQAGYEANLIAAEAGLRLFDLAEVKRRLEACPEELRGWEWRHLSFRSEMSERKLTGHTSRVYPVAFSPDGQWIASGSADPENEIRLWDAETGEVRWTVVGGVALPGQTSGGVRSLAFSPDGTRLASGSDDHSVRLWDAATGRKLAEFEGHEGRVDAVRFTPGGGEIVSASRDRTIRRWDVKSGATLATLQGHRGNIWDMAICGDGTRIVSGDITGQLRVWDRLTGETQFTRDVDAILAVACSPDSSVLAIGQGNGTIGLFDLGSGEPIASIDSHKDYVMGLAFSPDGARLASASGDRTIGLWDAIDGSALATLIGHENTVISVAFHPQGRTLISGSWDRSIRFWSADPADFSPILATGSESPYGLALTPDGSRIVLGTPAAGIRVLDAQSGAEIAATPMPDAPLVDLELSPDGKSVMTLDGNRKLMIWRLGPDGRAEIVAERSFENLASGAFMRNTPEILLGSSKGGTLYRWNFENDEIGEIATPLLWPSKIQPTDDDTQVIVAGPWRDTNHAALVLLDLESGVVLAQHEFGHFDPTAKIGNPMTDLQISPDGTRLVTTHGQDFTVRLWDAQTLEPLATMFGHTEIVEKAAFSPDGARIATAARDHSVRLWDAITGKPLLALRNDELASVNAVQFTPDGGTVISGQVSWRPTRSSIRLWRTHPQNTGQVSRAVHLLSRPMLGLEE